METKFTSGPWVVDGEYVRQEGEDDVAICEVLAMDASGGKGWFHGPITEANACLIAAAPDLLLACQGLLESAETGVTSLGVIRAARAAILKATGGGA